MKSSYCSSCVAVLLLPLAAVGTRAAITGQWDFNNTADPLVAALGQPLDYLDPGSDTPAQTQVGTTTSFGIPAIGGSEATVMKFGTNGFNRGYIAPHGIAANGGSFMVNDWTIIMDVLFPATSTGKWRALIQTDPFNTEGTDAEMYINEANAVGINSSYHGTVPANTWVRLAFVADLDAETPAVRKYINGTLVGQNSASLDGRFALTPDAPVALFTDGYVSDVYTQPGYISSLQIHDEALSDAYLAAIGSPTAGGIPDQVQVTPYVRHFLPTVTGASPEKEFNARIMDGLTRVNPNSIRLTLNSELVTPTITPLTDHTLLTFQDTSLLPAGSTNVWQLVYSDDATPPATITNTLQFVVAPYKVISLPSPLFFEDFESTAEGSLPTGWTNLSFTEIQNPEEDLGNLDSATYARWTVVDSSRFLSSFVTYSNPDNPQSWEDDYHRVLDYAPNYVVSNTLVKDFAVEKFAFANSGYRNGLSQVLELYSPDFNLTGHANVHLAFNSIWEQNQDSIAGVEYSIDRGQTWKPALYMIDRSQLITNTPGQLDAVATLTNEENTEIPTYIDNDGLEQGGTYGAFLKAPVSASLAPFISGRIDDDPRDSKRIEIVRLPEADNQATVRVRFFHAGEDSWYFGIDNVGLYSLSPVEPPGQVQISKVGDNVTITIPGGARLQKATSLSTPDWQIVQTPVGATSHTEAAGGTAAFYRAVSP